MDALKKRIEDLKNKERLHEEMPSCLKQRHAKIIALGIGVCTFAILVLIINFVTEAELLQIGLISAGMGICVLLFAKAFSYRVLYYGYVVIEGEITSINKKIIPRIREKNKIESIHITSDGKIYNIPASKDELVQMHSIVKAYFPSSVKFIEQNGIQYPSAVWGYVLEKELVAKENATSTKEEESEDI